MSFFISDAVASAGQAAPEASFMSILPMLVILRPQQKRTKEHRKLMESIGKGDEVLTTGGLIGRVVKVSDNGYIVVALNETTEVTIKRDFVAAVLPKGTMKAI